MSIEGQGNFFTIYFQVLYVLYFTRLRHQVSVYRTTGPLVSLIYNDFIEIHEYRNKIVLLSAHKVREL